MEKQKLIKVIEDLKEVRTETKSKVSDEVLFDCSIRIYNSEKIESNRQGNKPFDKSGVNESIPVFTLSPKQKNVLLKEYTEEEIKQMTKEEAYKILDKILGKNFKKNRENFERAYRK